MMQAKQECVEKSGSKSVVVLSLERTFSNKKRKISQYFVVAAVFLSGDRGSRTERTAGITLVVFKPVDFVLFVDQSKKSTDQDGNKYRSKAFSILCR